MTETQCPISYSILLVDDNDAIRDMMTLTLGHKGFDVVAAANVADALRLISTERFDALITDLHMPNPGDGFTVVSAMRHAQPDALTLLVSGYPDVKSAMGAILLEPDEIIMKPFEAGGLAELLRDRISNRKPAARLERERVSALLWRSIASIVEDWLARAKGSSEFNHLPLNDNERTGHLPKLVENLVVRLCKSSTDATNSDAAIAHGKLRQKQGYTPGMLVQESRILQVILFGALKRNLSLLDFSLLLPDVMVIADELDAQLTQTVDSYMKAMCNSAVA